MLIAYTLTMPNVGSWNGKWTGENRGYHVVRSYRGKAKEKLMAERCGNHYHGWSDGWSANVSARIVTSGEARELRRQSAGFCGYEWMIDTIEEFGRIRVEVHDKFGRTRWEDDPIPEDWNVDPKAVAS